MRGTLHISAMKVLVWSLIFSWIGLLYYSHRHWSCDTSSRVAEAVSDVDVHVYRPSQHTLTRLDRLYYGCQSECIKGYKLRYNQTHSRFDYSKTANVSVCSVPKAGSTLFTLVLLALEIPAGPDIATLFQMKRSKVHAQSGRYLRHTSDQMLPTRNILLTRDPYRRLFSAYVDKKMLKLPMHNINSSKMICDKHVAFDKFLNNVVSNGLSGGFIDPHVAPVYLLCKACHTRFEMVAKQETLSEDLTFLLENITVVPQHTRESILHLLHGDVNVKTLIGVIEVVVERASVICSNMLDYISTLWTVFKIQGVIRKDAAFPREDLEQLGTVDVTSVTSVVLSAIASHPLSSEDRRRQRRHALVTAYVGVSSQTVQRIQDMYFKDFVLFGYDVLPPSQQ